MMNTDKPMFGKVVLEIVCGILQVLHLMFKVLKYEVQNNGCSPTSTHE